MFVRLFSSFKNSMPTKIIVSLLKSKDVRSFDAALSFLSYKPSSECKHKLHHKKYDEERQRRETPKILKRFLYLLVQE